MALGQQVALPSGSKSAALSATGCRLGNAPCTPLLLKAVACTGHDCESLPLLPAGLRRRAQSSWKRWGGGLPSVLGGGLLLQMGFKPMVAARGFSNKQNPCLEAN